MCREYTQAYVWDSLRSEMRKQKKYDEVDLCLNRHLICLIFKAHALAIFFDHSAQLPLSSEGFGDYRAPVRVRYFEHGTKLNGCLLYETSLRLEQVMMDTKEGESQSLEDIILHCDE